MKCIVVEITLQYIHTCIESSCCVLETNRRVCVNYMSIKKTLKKKVKWSWSELFSKETIFKIEVFTFLSCTMDSFIFTSVRSKSIEDTPRSSLSLSHTYTHTHTHTHTNTHMHTLGMST